MKLCIVASDDSIVLYSLPEVLSPYTDKMKISVKERDDEFDIEFEIDDELSDEERDKIVSLACGPRGLALISPIVIPKQIDKVNNTISIEKLVDTLKSKKSGHFEVNGLDFDNNGLDIGGILITID